MKQPPDRDIAEQIVIALGRPLRGSKTQAEAEAVVEMKIALLREAASIRFPDADSIKKATRELLKALKPFLDGQQIPLRSSVITMRELRYALNWCGSIDGPSNKFDVLKHLAAIYAYGLADELSQKRPTGGRQVREIAGFLYQAITGEWVELKRQTDAVRRNWIVQEYLELLESKEARRVL
jgi:hypothetical protein